MTAERRPGAHESGFVGQITTDDRGRVVYVYELIEGPTGSYRRKLLAHFNYGDIHRPGRRLSVRFVRDRADVEAATTGFAPPAAALSGKEVTA